MTNPYVPEEVVTVRKKPVEVQAMQCVFQSGDVSGMMKVYNWIQENTLGSYDCNDPDVKAPSSGVSISAESGNIVIATLEGEMVVQNGDWVIQGVKGEFYPCKPDIFHATYVEVEE